MTETAVGRPLRELHFPDQLGAHPVGTRRARRPPGEGRRRLRERIEAATEVRQSTAAEASADLADVDQRSVIVVHAKQQCPDTASLALGFGEAADHELLLLDTLRLLPAAPATGFVRCVASLRHDALEGHAAGMAEERLTVADHVIAVAKDGAARAVDEGTQHLLALLERAAGEVAAVEVQQIEDEVHRLIIGLGAERVL